MIAKRLATGFAGLSFAGSAISLLGWSNNVPGLTDWDGDGITMFANTAIATGSCAAALLLLMLTRPDSRVRAPLITVLCLAALAIAGLTLCEHAFNSNLGIDTLFITPRWGERAASSPGRMGPPASFTLAVASVALLLSQARVGSRSRQAAAILAMIVALPPLLSCTAYLYGATSLYSLPLTGIAGQTALLLCLLMLGITLAIDEFGLAALLRRNDVAGMIVRRLLPISIGLLLLSGWLEDLGARMGYYERSVGSAGLTIVRIVMFTTLLWWTADTVAAQIAHRTAVERELSRTQERYRIMIDSIQQLAWIARPDGWVSWYNRRFYEYTGTTPEQVEGWGWRTVHDPKILPDVMDRWTTSLATGTPLDIVFPIRGADGKYRPFLTRAVPVKDANGAVLHWFGTNTDISEQRAAEQSLREANRIKDEFLATLSHELRTPMSAILGWAQMLRTSTPDAGAPSPADVAQGLEIIERNARLQSQIIQDLLDMNRIVSGKVRLDVQSLDLSRVLVAAVDAVRPSAAAKGLRLQCVCDPHITDLRGDPGRLQQVFYNLLSNAVKFTPRGGIIQVICRRVNSHIEVAVSDTGVGIKPAFLPHVFERFRQQDASTTRTFGGLGLGLAIVKYLIELHGGTVHAASDGDDKGATFTVLLPVAVAVAPTIDSDETTRRHPAAEAWTTAPAVPPDVTDQLTGIKTLIVDDEPDARELLRRLFEQHGAVPILAASAAEALEMLPQQRPNVLVCDIGMPVMNGYDLIKAIRELPTDKGGETPAIALTAFARSEDRTRSIRAGFQLHLSKPVEAAELLASVASLARHLR